MHMLSKKDLSPEELETLRRSRIPTVVLTANGEVQTIEEAQENVHDLCLFVTAITRRYACKSYRLENSAKNTDTPMSGSAVKDHG